MEQNEIDRLGRQIATTAQHSKLVEETTREQRREAARDRLLLSMADTLGVILRHTYTLTGHDISNFEPMSKELRDAKILFAGTLDRS